MANHVPTLRLVSSRLYGHNLSGLPAQVQVLKRKGFTVTKTYDPIRRTSFLRPSATIEEQARRGIRSLQQRIANPRMRKDCRAMARMEIERWRGILLRCAAGGTLLLLALRGCEPCPAAISDAEHYVLRFKMLSQIESGNNDLAHGKDGERGRYQETQAAWREFNPTNCWPNFKNLTNADFSICAAEGLMAIRVLDFKNKMHREPTDSEWYLLWHRPARVFHPEPAEAERARRFANLCKSLMRGGKSL